ncbi:MAG TPA: hypothetical protein DCL60_07705 [Armatimonadetes bacterium]|nr:hypothetical protein [Armatimonadota bacterium]
MGSRQTPAPIKITGPGPKYLESEGGFMRILISALLAVITALPAFAQEIPYTEITGTVLSVKQMEFPRARLSLKITKSANPSILEIRGESAVINVENRLLKKNGNVDFTNRQNTGAIAAYYLLQGDEINANLINGAVRGFQGLIYGITRTAGNTESSGSARLNDLKLTLATDKESYAEGEPVAITLSVTNSGTEARTLKFASGQQYDFVVSKDGREVWKWSAGKYFAQSLVSRVIGPGEVLRFKQVWNQEKTGGGRANPGEYCITGMLILVEGKRPSVGPLTIKIVPKA